MIDDGFMKIWNKSRSSKSAEYGTCYRPDINMPNDLYDGHAINPIQEENEEHNSRAIHMHSIM